jgi:L-fucose isomerase-like protein
MESNTKFGFIPVASSITQMPIENIIGELLSPLHSLGGEHFSDLQINLPVPIFYFVVTGGTEEKILQLCSERKNFAPDEPTVLIAHGQNNSLPSAIEVLARLQQNDERGKIVYINDASSRDWQHELERIVKHHQIFYQLKKTKIGLIGKPSDWLVASKPEFSVIKNVWGPDVIEIDLNELKNLIPEIKDEEVEEEHYSFTTKTTGIKEPSKKEIKNVVKVYGALKRIIKKYELTSVSLRCFDLVTELKTTGCFALSKLNDDGIIAGCEGDLVSTIGMLWSNYLTNQTVWMANPAQLDEQNNSIWLAHCTVPISMAEKYQLRSHFESGLGVGIQGELSKGKVTVLRLGGKNLDKVWISNAEILENGVSDNLCRTQVKVKLHGSAKATDLLTAPLGNHLLLMRGSHTKELLEWKEMFIKNK